MSIEKNTRAMWLHQSNCGFLNSHRIKGNVIVPIMLVSEWCIRLTKSIFPHLHVVEVKDVKVVKKIQLDNFEKEGDVVSFIFTILKGLDGTVAAINIENELGQLCYSVTIILAAEHTSPRLETVDQTEWIPWSLKKCDIYKDYLFHGKDFQVIKKLAGISDERAKGLLKIKSPSILKEAALLSDMFLYDGGIQLAILAMGIWSKNYSSLPLGYASLKIYRQLKLSKEMCCELLVTKKSDMNSEWEIIFKDKENHILAEMSGLRMYMFI